MIRTIAPDIQPILQLKTGFPKLVDNIYKLISDEGVFKLEIVFPNGGYGMVPNKFHAIYGTDLLLSGTASKTADQIASEIDGLGGYIFKGCDYYSSSITIFGMNENLIKLIDIIKDAAFNCSFSQRELDVYKTRKISELNINLNKTSFLASRSINQLLTGSDHPYSLASTEESIKSISSSDLLAYKNNYLKDPFFIFTGSDSTKIDNILNISGFNIGNSGVSNIQGDQYPKNDKMEELIQKDSTQNSIRMGKILPARTDKDYFTLNLFNLILGGYFGSRLMKNIREEKGLTYGIHSSIVPFKTYSLFKISSDCNSKLTYQVKDEIFKEIQALQLHKVGQEELFVAKNYLLGALSRSFDGAFNISERLKSFLELDSDENYYGRYFDAINQITADQIQDCANNYFDLNSLKYCIAGDI